MPGIWCLPPLQPLTSGSHLGDLRHGDPKLRRPVTMKIFVGLRELLLEDNLLTRLPEDLDHLVNLKVLTLMNNPMEDPPMAVCAQGNDAIWNCLKENRLRKIMATKVRSTQVLFFFYLKIFILGQLYACI